MSGYDRANARRRVELQEDRARECRDLAGRLRREAESEGDPECRAVMLGYVEVHDAHAAHADRIAAAYGRIARGEPAFPLEAP